MPSTPDTAGLWHCAINQLGEERQNRTVPQGDSRDCSDQESNGKPLVVHSHFPAASGSLHVMMHSLGEDGLVQRLSSMLVAS